MPFLFTLPTTSHLNFSGYLSSDSHASLPFSATINRGILRDALKANKKLPPPSRALHLAQVLSALNEYLPYLFALDAALSNVEIAGEEIILVLEKEIETEWRPTLTSSTPGRDQSRVKLKSLEYELFFLLSTLAYTNTLLAREKLHLLYSPITPSTDQRSQVITAATKYLLEASAIHDYLRIRSEQLVLPPPVVDISTVMFSSLSSLSLAEATLLAVLKDDPYPAIVTQSRNPHNKDWMFKAPEIPKVRANLFARVCLAAAEHTSKALALLAQSAKVDTTLLEYIRDLRRVSRAKACRFSAIDAELDQKTGLAIAWLRAGKIELGILPSRRDQEKKISGLAKLKKGWSDKREDRKIEAGAGWGSDAGKLEEERVIEILESKWAKMNDTINTQPIPDSGALIAALPSGRNFHTVPKYQVPSLDKETLKMTQLPATAFEPGHQDDSSDEEYQAE
ncbi:MAG: hypothetical protein M1829_001690 [Trizodia sp. TS-e1964]|nr:MAG: hypothetical protein M1829_001690 [Trizodia sp. TS-e1964]